MNKILTLKFTNEDESDRCLESNHENTKEEFISKLAETSNGFNAQSIYKDTSLVIEHEKLGKQFDKDSRSKTQINDVTINGLLSEPKDRPKVKSVRLSQFLRAESTMSFADKLDILSDDKDDVKLLGKEHMPKCALHSNGLWRIRWDILI